MQPALRGGAIDLAISLRAEVVSDRSYLTIRRQPVAALLPAKHPTGAGSISLDALADDGFLMFPRDLAPRLYDFMVGLWRRAGFEPRIRGESFRCLLDPSP
jgi:DNA-binding transcriptional LysR family regulator